MASTLFLLVFIGVLFYFIGITGFIIGVVVALLYYGLDYLFNKEEREKRKKEQEELKELQDKWNNKDIN